MTEYKEPQDFNDPTLTEKSSYSVSELFTALSKFQSEVPAIERNKTVKVKMKSGGQYSFTYSPLDNTLATIRPVLSKHGLALSQVFDGDSILTLLTHSSGQWLKSTMPIKLDHNNPQDTGEAITYKRRYAVESIVGISATDDMDANGVAGNTASVEGKNEEKSTPKKSSTSNKRSKDMNATEAMKYIRDTDNEDLEGFLSPDENRKTVLSIWESQVGALPEGLGEDDEPEEETEEEEPPFEPDDEEEEETEEFDPDSFTDMKKLVTEYTRLKKEHGEPFKEKYFDAVQEKMKEFKKG